MSSTVPQVSTHVISPDEAWLIGDLDRLIRDIKDGKFKGGLEKIDVRWTKLTKTLYDKIHERIEDDFRHDEGDPERKYLPSIEDAKCYMSLPLPRDLEKKTIQSIGMDKSDENDVMTKLTGARHLLRRHSPHIISMMAGTHVGQGTDPERLDQQILNHKKQVLDHSIFPTCWVVCNLHQTVESVHTLTRSACLAKSNKIDFGLSGGFQGVHLGFEIVREDSQFKTNQEIIGIADLRYQWGVMESRIKHEKLYKYLASDCKKAISRINETLDQANPPEEATKQLSRVLSHFVEKYGTHVILRCTFGFRLEKTQKGKADENFNLQTFKAGIMVDALGYASARSGFSRMISQDSKSVIHSANVRSIGPVHSLVKAMTEKITKQEWKEHLSGDGDADVISHDWTMMISNILRGNQNYQLASNRLDFWIHVRINDLRAGWTGSIFACSYKLKFRQQSTEGVCVEIEGYSSVHEPPDIGFVTDINSYDVETVNICTTSGKKLKDVLEQFVLYRRFILCSDGGKTGSVFVNEFTDFPDQSYHQETVTTSDFKKSPAPVSTVRYTMLIDDARVDLFNNRSTPIEPPSIGKTKPTPKNDHRIKANA